LTICVLIFSCRKDPKLAVPDTTPYEPDYPELFEQYVGPMSIPQDNPMTVEGIALGKKLFYDTLLSNTQTVNCNTCHKQEYAFTTPSNALANIQGGVLRNVMPLYNLGWVDKFPWDGRKNSLEEKIEESIQNPFTLDGQSDVILPRLQADPFYPSEFEVVFGDDEITMERLAQALAQFIRTMISGSTPYDRYLLTGIGTSGLSSADEIKMIQGAAIFKDPGKGDCQHCHGSEVNPLLTVSLMQNNGMDTVFDSDRGYMWTTGSSGDEGKFRTPSLRNVEVTGPYMHDGRFTTLDEVIEHYSTGVVWSPTIDGGMEQWPTGGNNLSPSEKDLLKFFLECLTDDAFLTDPQFKP
jgi:cytochrome c peroxidase